MLYITVFTLDFDVLILPASYPTDRVNQHLIFQLS